MKQKLFASLSLALIMAMLVTSLALADNVTNDITVGGNDTFTLGGSTTVSYKIVATGGDGQSGCNASDGSAATVTINTPVGVTATPGSLTFTTCGDFKPVVFTAAAEGNYSITVSVSDSGTGTYHTTPATFTLHVLAPPKPTDETPPVITPNVVGTPGSNGWYVSNVTVSWTVTDDESTITSTSGCDSTTINADTAGTMLTCTATSAGGTSSQSVTIKRDATAPTLSPSVSPNPVTLNGSATATPNASDATSGVASSSCDAVDTSSVGTHSVNCTATDNAGNTTSASASYSVIYNWSGFFQPVDNFIINVAKAGQAIPLKWRLTDANGNPVLNLTSVKVTVANLACNSGITVDQVEEYAAGASGLQNLGDGYYQFNWKTPSTYASSCKTMKLDLGEGAGKEHTALFQFKK